MSESNITCCVIGAQEQDLYVLGELNKRRDVEIVFVYDRDASAVGLDIAEILGVKPIHNVDELREAAAAGGLGYAIVTDVRGPYATEIDALAEAGARVIGQEEALKTLCGHAMPPAHTDDQAKDTDSYSLDDALAAFERLFDRTKLLEFLLDVAVRATGATTGSVMLHSAEAGELYIGYATGLSERIIRNTRQKIGEGIAGMVASERKARLVTDSSAQAMYAADRDRVNVRSAVCVPLEWEDRLLGVVNVSSDRPDVPLGRPELEKMQKLSTRMAKVLFESIRYEETRVRHDDMNLRQKMGELSTSSATASAKFTIISKLLGDLLGANTVEVFVGTDQGDWLVLGGSSRRVLRNPDLIRTGGGAVSRAFLDGETVLLTETPVGQQDGMASSLMFVPLSLKEPLGVLMLEFSDRKRLDDFLTVKTSVTLELSRFIAAERHDRRMRRELKALGKVSDSAPVLLTCNSVEELCEFLSRLVADTLECERVSVRILGLDGASGKIARYEDAGGRSASWAEEDDQRFLKLKQKNEGFSLAFMDFGGEAAGRMPSYHSLIASPIMMEDTFVGGIIAYDRRPDNAFEETTFSELDTTLLQQIVAFTVPVLRTLGRLHGKAPADEVSYDEILAGNSQRLRKVMETEMARSDRYHNAFSLLLLKIKPLEQLFDRDYNKALGIVDEVTRGIQTRTRKNDYATWIRRDTIAMITLEGTQRIKFLTSRLMLYLVKDFSSLGAEALTDDDVLIAHGVYPGTARTPEALLGDVEKSLSQPPNS